ncbi:nucleotide-binding protein [Methanotorris igneus]|uniref:Cobyrinic acid ac-diamide synthase n=1 Tax=Methanotorris igneus (strain DSM 5666 / JCM 11834 / Kol 5) TaxID=880724 RepID=F6BBK8_METIK|nr:ATP-binding protein [Methanotorris igneus]AEF96017.1 Cobyrinic acid ac-diamide synthase [Methanotorris igneus Kol 5]
MKIGIVSGKGGVGKSSISTSLAKLFSRELNIIALDCDVDAPNFNLMFDVKDKKLIEVIYRDLYKINENCTFCGKCQDICKFGAIEEYKINPILCEGCGACELICEYNAIEPINHESGYIYEGNCGFPLIWGELEPGESGSGKIIEHIKRHAKQYKSELEIIDGPPGVGCPLFATVKDIDLALCIVEPTKSSVNDCLRLIETLRFFGIDYLIVENKKGMNSIDYPFKIFHSIPYDFEVPKLIANKILLCDGNGKASKAVKELYEKLKEFI